MPLQFTWRMKDLPEESITELLIKANIQTNHQNTRAVNRLAIGFCKRILGDVLRYTEYFGTFTIYPPAVCQALQTHAANYAFGISSEALLIDDDDAEDAGISVSSDIDSEGDSLDDDDDSYTNEFIGHSDDDDNDVYNYDPDDCVDICNGFLAGPYAPVHLPNYLFDLSLYSTNKFNDLVGIVNQICHLSDDYFHRHILRPILRDDYRCNMDFQGNSIELLKHAMYAYVVFVFEEERKDVAANQTLGNTAATKIQAIARGSIYREKKRITIEEEASGATKMQALVRGWIYRKKDLPRKYKEALASRDAALATKDAQIADLMAALKRKNVTFVDLENTGTLESPPKRARINREGASPLPGIVKEDPDKANEEEEEGEVTILERVGQGTTGTNPFRRVTRNRSGAGQVKIENLVQGDVRCPDPACGRIISTQDGRGCNILACTYHRPQYLYFCMHCKKVDENGTGLVQCGCPKRNTMRDRTEAQELRNRRSMENPIVID